MGRATTKDELISAANGNYDKLNALIASMSMELNTPFDFAYDEKKTESHWQRDKNIRDVYIHLYEWHQLVLNFVQSNLNNDKKPFIPEPYNWKTYLDMNIELWQKHQSTPLDDARDMFYQSYQEVMMLVETFSNEQLFAKKVYDWVGGSTLGSYFISCTASHYDWAMKKLKAHKKKCDAK